MFQVQCTAASGLRAMLQFNTFVEALSYCHANLDRGEHTWNAPIVMFGANGEQLFTFRWDNQSKTINLEGNYTEEMISDALAGIVKQKKRSRFFLPKGNS